MLKVMKEEIFTLCTLVFLFVFTKLFLGVELLEAGNHISPTSHLPNVIWKAVFIAHGNKMEWCSYRA